MAVAKEALSGQSNRVTVSGDKTALIPKSIKNIMLQKSVKRSVEKHLSNDLSRLLNASCDCV